MRLPQSHQQWRGSDALHLSPPGKCTPYPGAVAPGDGGTPVSATPGAAAAAPAPESTPSSSDSKGSSSAPPGAPGITLSRLRERSRERAENASSF